MRLLAVVLVLFSGCGTEPLPSTPLTRAKSIAEAKQIAQEIAAQNCEFLGLRVDGTEDVAVVPIDCDRGVYSFEVSVSHLYEKAWFSDGKVRFEYSDKLLMPSYFLGEAKNQDLNPAYYLRPILQ